MVGVGAAVGPVCPPLLATARCPEAGSVREGPCWRQSCFGGAISVSEGGPLRWMTGRAGQGVGPVGRQREIRPRGRSREHQPRGPFMCPHKAGAIILCSSPAQPRGPRALSVLGGSIPPWSRVAGGLGPPADMECLSSQGAAQAGRGTREGQRVVRPRELAGMLRGAGGDAEGPGVAVCFVSRAGTGSRGDSRLCFCRAAAGQSPLRRSSSQPRSTIRGVQP